MTQYVMKRGTTRFLVATPELLKRDDMVPVDIETIKVRIAAQKRLLAEKKALLATKQQGLPQEIIDGAEALKSLQDEIAETDKRIAELDKDNVPVEKREPENEDEENEKVFNDLVNEDKEIRSLRSMRKAKSAADYLEVNYGISQEYTDDDTDKLKEQAVNLRTETLREQFNSK
jgi:septal ring factor EnvC (AmiA/AmiB activator)